VNIVLLKFAALAAVAASAATAATSPALVASSPWWERVTVTVDGNGKPQGCQYETSLSEKAAQSCDVEGSQAALAHGNASDQLTRITFERRFNPGAAPQDAALETGDTLLGRQVLALAIDPKGAVSGCKIVAESGDMTPDYGCKEAEGERFQTSAQRSATQQGYMTILVYGHAEHVV
jgi:hypothetical protein